MIVKQPTTNHGGYVAYVSAEMIHEVYNRRVVPMSPARRDRGYWRSINAWLYHDPAGIDYPYVGHDMPDVPPF